MDEHTEENLKKGSQHLLHGLEDAGDVIGHGALGAVEGAADGVEHASAASKLRQTEAE
jgi:hypothetical protein